MSRKQFYSFVTLMILLVAAGGCFFGKEDGGSNQTAVNRNAADAPKTAVESPESNKKEDKGDFIVEHLPLKNARYAEIDRQVKEEKLLEKAADKLNRSLRLPRDIFLRAKDCGEVNAFYDGEENSVTVCYELVEHFYNVFRRGGLSEEKARVKMFDAARFAFLHEIGHALIETYQLPITGSEEDAADRCSAFINLTELGEDGIRAVLAAADAFAIESKNAQAGKPNLADEHLLQEQRFYNSLCMLYGANQQKHAYVTRENYLPKERAERCPQEYERMVQSWRELLRNWRNE